MAHLKRYLTACLTSLLLIIGAQFLGAAEPVGPTFQLISVSPEAIYDLSYDLKGQTVRLLATPAEPSRNYKLPPGDTLKLFKEVDAPDAPSGKIRVPMAEISIAHITPPLLVMIAPSPIKDSPLPYVGKAVNFIRLPSPLDTAQISNFSRRQIAIQIGASQASLNPGESKIVPYTVEFRAQTIPFRLAVHGEKGWEAVVDTSRPMEQNVRMLGLVFDATAATAAELGPVTLTMITDRTQPAVEHKAP